MDLLFARSPLLLLLAVAAAAAFSWWSYGRMVPLVPTRKRLLLCGLRFAALGVVIALLFEPLLRQITTREEAPVFAVVIDRTQSLAPEEGTGTGAHETRDVLARFPSVSGETAFFTFAGDLQALAGPPAAVSFGGVRTDIAGALAEVARRLEGRNLRGVLLISDGRYNTGRNPLYLAERYPAPIYTLTVGDTVRPRDVRIADVVTNEIAYTGVVLPVRVSVQTTGFAGERATVTLRESGRALAQQTVTLPADGLVATTELVVTPTLEGLRRYTVAVTQFDGEATHRNNLQTVTVRVMSARRRVLLLAGAPGPDVAALRQELETDPNLEIVPRTQRGPGAYYEGRLPDDLARFDLAVLAGFPGPVSGRGDAETVARAVEAGLPVLYVLTQRSDLTGLAGTLGEVLPARPEAPRPGFHEAHLHPTAAGAAHPVLEVPGAPAGALDRLPPVLQNESRWAVSPDARTLGSARVRGIVLDDPLIVIRQRGRQRSAAVLAAGTWRWRTLPPDLEELGGFYSGLVQNLVRWLTAREDARPVRVRAIEALFDATEPVRLAGQVYDESLAPVSDAELEVRITAPDGTELPFPMRPLGHGRYTLEAGTLAEGEYTFRAIARRAGSELGTDAGAFAVGALTLELQDLYADQPLMRELAQRSGGAALRPSEISQLTGMLEGQLRPRVVATERTTELWRLPPLLLLIVGLLTAEWVVRKRSGMV
jgi:hypothetical protein